MSMFFTSTQKISYLSIVIHITNQLTSVQALSLCLAFSFWHVHSEQFFMLA